MAKEQTRIISSCHFFVCRECRTKVGWRHQRWCPAAGKGKRTCEQCLYRNLKLGICIHPMLKREGAVKREKIEYPL